MQELKEFRIDYNQCGDTISARLAELQGLLAAGWRVYSSHLYNRHERGGMTVTKIHFLEREVTNG